MASYQTFIQTISENVVFVLKSEDGRYVREDIKIVDGQERSVFNLNSNTGPRTIFILKAILDSNNFFLFVRRKNNTEFPVNFIVDGSTGAQYLTFGFGINNRLQINPVVINQPVIQFAQFTSTLLKTSIKVDEFNFLRFDGFFPSPKFGFEAVIPHIIPSTRDAFNSIKLFFTNSNAVNRVIETNIAFLVSIIQIEIVSPIAIIMSSFENIVEYVFNRNVLTTVIY